VPDPAARDQTDSKYIAFHEGGFLQVAVSEAPLGNHANAHGHVAGVPDTALRLIGTDRGSRDDSSGCTVKRRSTPAVRMPFPEILGSSSTENSSMKQSHKIVSIGLSLCLISAVTIPLSAQQCKPGGLDRSLEDLASGRQPQYATEGDEETPLRPCHQR
jgi:hypothetical protein